MRLSSKILPALAAAAVSLTAVMVTAVMTEYRFTPDHLSFRQDVRYRLRLENRVGKLLSSDDPPSTPAKRSSRVTLGPGVTT